MKKTIFSLIICISILSISVELLAGSASASIDHACHFNNGSIVVPQGQTATNFNVTLSSSWLPCQGASTPHRIGARILGPGGNALYYGVKYRDNRSETLAGNIATLTLRPGTYTFEVPDGGKQTSANVSFKLNNAAPPVAAGTPVPANWGTLNGDWTDPTIGSKAKIVQSGNQITMTNSLMWQGNEVVWSGSGTISGDKVTFPYRYTKNKPAMWEGGTMTLTRTAKKKLSGSWVTNSGNFTQPITFIQTKSDDPARPTPPAPTPVAKKKAPKPAARRTATTQPNPCPAGFHHRGGGECIPNTRAVEER